jgi:hypothetical protein
MMENRVCTERRGLRAHVLGDTNLEGHRCLSGKAQDQRRGVARQRNRAEESSSFLAGPKHHSSLETYDHPDYPRNQHDLNRTDVDRCCPCGFPHRQAPDADRRVHRHLSATLPGAAGAMSGHRLHHPSPHGFHQGTSRWRLSRWSEHCVLRQRAEGVAGKTEEVTTGGFARLARGRSALGGEHVGPARRDGFVERARACWGACLADGSTRLVARQSSPPARSRFDSNSTNPKKLNPCARRFRPATMPANKTVRR